MYYFRVTTDGQSPSIKVNGLNQDYLKFSEPQYATYSVTCGGTTKQGSVYLKDNTDLFVCFHNKCGCAPGSDIPDYSGHAGDFLTNDGDVMFWGEVPDKTYSNENPVPAPVGAIQPGTTFDDVSYNDMFTSLLYPYVKPSVALSILPSNESIMECGTQVEYPVDLTAEVTRRSNQITSVVFYRDDKIIHTVENPDSGSHTYIYSYTDMTKPIIEDTNFSCVVSDGTNTVTATQKYEFEYPYYFGALDENTPTEQLVKALNKNIVKKQNVTAPITAEDNYPAFAFPAEWGLVKSIKDPNGFNVTNSFARTTLPFIMLDGMEVSYNIYVLKTRTSVEDYEFEFTFPE